MNCLCKCHGSHSHAPTPSISHQPPTIDLTVSPNVPFPVATPHPQSRPLPDAILVPLGGSLIDTVHPSTNVTGHPSTSLAGHPPTSLACHPPTNITGHPSTSLIGHPSTIATGPLKSDPSEVENIDMLNGTVKRTVNTGGKPDKQVIDQLDGSNRPLSPEKSVADQTNSGTVEVTKDKKEDGGSKRVPDDNGDFKVSSKRFRTPAGAVADKVSRRVYL